MPYISTEEVKEIRNAIKAALPKAKFSIRREHYSSVNVVLLKSNVDFKFENGRGHAQVNQYHYQNHDYTDAQKKIITKILDAVQKAHPRKIESEDGDYGSIPNYYFNLSIGSWNKPYQKVA